MMIVFLDNKTTIASIMPNQDSEIKDGKLNIENEIIANIGPIKLDGEWLFFWDRFLTPQQFDVKNEDSFIVDVPNNWNDYKINEVERYGHATYLLNVKVNEADLGEVVSLYIPNVATAYDLWINGEHLVSSGKVGKNRKEMKPHEHPEIITFTIKQSEFDVLIHVSNFHQRKSGLWNSLTFGTVEQINELKSKNILLQSFVVGCILIIGFYHLVIFYYRTTDLSALFFAITCFAIGLRTMILREKLFFVVFPQINWEIGVTIEYLAAIYGILFFLLFIMREIAFEKIKKINIVFVFLLLFYSLFVVFTPARIFTNTYTFLEILIFLIVVTIISISIYGVKMKFKSAYLNLFGLFVLALAVLNDLLFYSNKISTDEFVSFGMLFYLFTQSIRLARRSAKSYERNEKLSKELQTLNTLLETKVEKRTKELQIVNTKLREMENARRRLLASVSHELNTPLTFIQGYVKAMMDGVVPKEDSTYLRAVYKDTQMMARMIEDLQELSTLESGQFTFQLEDVDIRLFLRQLYEEQRPSFKEFDLNFTYKEQVAKVNIPVVCSIDPIRIKQVFNNLIVNAQKFTPAGGIVTVEVEIPAKENENEIKVSVIDTGIGIDKHDIPYIFERFYKVNGKQYYSEKGSGLGLVITKEIVENHGGEIGVMSKIMEGSSFYFTLPIKEENNGEKKNNTSSRRRRKDS